MIDFTPCEVNKFRAYGGANGNKINVRYQGEGYMLKFPPVPTRSKTISYTNSCISEYLYQQFPERLWDRAGFYPPSNGGADAHPGRPAEGPFLGCIYCGRAAGEL